jgi:hypothetical protein
MTKTGHTYTPKTTVDAEKRVREAFEATGHDGFTGAVGVELAFFQGTRARKDVDNLVKLIWKEGFKMQGTLRGVHPEKFEKV